MEISAAGTAKYHTHTKKPVGHRGQPLSTIRRSLDMLTKVEVPRNTKKGLRNDSLDNRGWE